MSWKGLTAPLGPVLLLRGEDTYIQGGALTSEGLGLSWNQCLAHWNLVQNSAVPRGIHDGGDGWLPLSEIPSAAEAD